jgi:hypothetical protein
MANGWDPSTVSSHSKKKLDWICSLGHTWQCAVGDMTSKNLGCPYCSGQRTLSGFNDLLTKFPEIAAQAHGWDPTTVAPRSSKKMEWKCEAGHVSIAPVSSRTSGNGCPYCSGSKTLAGFNDLATSHPQLAAEAHGWDPQEYSKGSNYLADWICTHGHVWKTTISERRSKNLGCPYCSGKRTLAGFNDLASAHPEIAAEAHGWDPTSVTKGSGKVMNWKCDSGHTYRMKVIDRTHFGHGCQFCSGKKVLVGFNDLTTTHPELAARAVRWDPTTVTKGSKQVKEWKCKAGHIYKSQVQAQTKSGGCPVCSGHQIIVGSNDLATLEPEIAAQAHGWDPTAVTVSSGKKLPWICQFGHTWTTNVASRTNHTSNCPTCSGRKVLVGFNDLLTKFPAIAAEAHGWDPTTVTKGSKQVKEWKCAQGHLWKVAIQRRTGSEKSGCPTCSNHKLLSGFNDLASKFPEIGKQAYGWDPNTTPSGSNEKREWICEYGHLWTATVTSRTNSKSGCPVCIGRKVLIGFNDLATTHPELAATAIGWDPSSVTFGSNKIRKWVCLKGHYFDAPIASRISRGRGCPYCVGQKILVGFNDLSTTDPNIASEAIGWDPSTVTRATQKKRKWICALGHQWTASIAGRTKENSGCPSCAKPGFDPNRQAWLYFLENTDLAMWQIGITNHPDQRLSKHAKGGWELIELRGPMEGDLTQDLESNCLKALIKRGAILGHKAGIEKFDGYSEAWTKTSLTVESLKQILDWVYEDEETQRG